MFFSMGGKKCPICLAGKNFKTTNTCYFLLTRLLSVHCLGVAAASGSGPFSCVDDVKLSTAINLGTLISVEFDKCQKESEAILLIGCLKAF
jgi:hypothetical protein